jgi:hypothetical protein
MTFPATQRDHLTTGDAMSTVRSPRPTGAYALATGEAADYRLQVLHGVYGPGTRRALLDAGLRPGMRAADLGCGVGLVTALLAELVGPAGHVVGVDATPGKSNGPASGWGAGRTPASSRPARPTRG